MTYNDPYEQQTQYQQLQTMNLTFTSDLICSIIQMVFVPCLYGLIPLIITLMANSAWKKGDFEGYQKRTKAAKICLIIGWIILGIEAIVVFGGGLYLLIGLVNSGF